MTDSTKGCVDESTRAPAPASPIRYLWIGVATVLGWSLYDHVPYVNLDRSWAHGLHLAHLEGHLFGEDIVFNYGPIGFIARPVAGTGIVYAIGVVSTLMLTCIGAVMVYRTLASLAIPTAVVGPATALVTLVAPFENLLVETLLVLGAVVLVQERRGGHDRPTLVAAVAGVGVVVLGLIKVSVVLPCLIVAIVTTWVNRRAVAASVLAMGATFVAIWLAAGQRLSSTPKWLRGAFEIASGHVSAMNVGDPSRRWEYFAVALIAVAATALVVDVQTLRRLRVMWRSEQMVAVVVIVVVGWFTIRQGFTLHGGRTRLVFFSACWMIVGLAPWQTLSHLRQRGLAVLAVASAVCFVVAAGSLVRLVDPVIPVGDAVESARLVVSPGYREERVEQARIDARSGYQVPGSMVERIGDAPVVIDPYEISAAWAYDLDWVPFPSMQRYLGYTPYLDQRNADLLDGEDAPAFVLRQRFAVIQRRYAPAESPAFVTALFCNYRVVEASDRWDLLERSTNRCADPVEVQTLRIVPGQTVEIPSQDGAATLVAIDFDRSLSNTIASVLLKPISNPHMGIDDRRFRMLPATSNSPALLVGASDWDEGAGLVGGASTLTVDTHAEVTFSSMRILADP